MPVNLKRKNIILLASFLSGALLLLLWMRDHAGKKALLERTSSTSTSSIGMLKSPRNDAGGPALPAPIVQSNYSSKGRSYVLEGMRSQAENLNFEQAMKNKDKFGDHTAENPIIVVQAHDRHEFLKLLLESLRKVRGIESVTLVISRDKFTKEMDDVIDSSTDFCRYLEIFFPFSMQLYPDKFPGEDPNDCPRDISKSEARRKGCINAEYPDKYGHYREVKYVQLKHHWFWKLNMVFQGIRELKDNTGPILILEDDNYVVADLIDVMKKAVALQDSQCPDCLAITLGAYDSVTDYRTLGHVTEVKPWVSSKYNIGMALNQKFYEKLSACSKYFCEYDDYNWDWTLQSTALKCFNQPLYTIVTKVPRVYHLGCTGFHQKRGGRCDVEAEVERLRHLLESEANNLFPASLEMTSITKTSNPSHVQNGGWGDIRDHELCQKYAGLCKSYLDVADQ